ncbi:glutamyl-tRNA reductase [Thiomicrospira microaerophila]|uniref:glutamyl-tRNA reductase n=1 Tax=Thiomicrospira microaerophila TaxID=406020 RepID=UPI0020104FD7|nr:glutamyl-tRNA reductase [Thiomicrospira microaerophila]UQB41315.1 glutamyl-tRNA reductase [Thiomicrospira microaerophila]
MNLFALGVNHETAPVNIRETVSFTADRVFSALQELKDQQLVAESIILSTCNRTEIYFTVKNSQAQPVIDWLHQFFCLTNESLKPYIYLHQDINAVTHIMRVASGLNSLVLGEPQILGQIKDAYNLAHKTESVHHTLENLFQHVFRTAKQVRTDTAIGSSPVSVAFAAVSLAKQFFGDLSQQTALLIGAGETIELVARHLHESHIGRIVIANRTFNRAHALAEQLGGYAIELDELEQHLHEADMVIASTGSPTQLIKRDQVKKALKKRRHRPMFMVDIAVPRDIEASINDFEDVYLYSVDDLQEIIAENKRSRQDAASEAEDIIQMQAERFMCQYQAIQCVNPLIRAYRHQADMIKKQMLEQAMHQLALGQKPEAVIHRLAHQLTNKLIHTPSHQLHEAGIAGKQDLIEMAEQLLFDKESR